jgi:predicted N-acetyltransferase YhbS
MVVNRVGWKQVGEVKEPGRYMYRFGFVTITSDDLQVWSQFPDATFALYEVSGEGKDEYRLGTIDLNTPASNTEAHSD